MTLKPKSNPELLSVFWNIVSSLAKISHKLFPSYVILNNISFNSSIFKSEISESIRGIVDIQCFH